MGALGYGWKGFTNNLGPILLIVLVVWAVNVLVNAFSYLAGNNRALVILAGVLAIIVSWILGIGLVRAALAILDGRSPQMSDLFSAKDLLPFVVASILAGLIVMAGTLLCVIPGLIAAFLLYFFAYAIVDGKTDNPIEALKISYRVVSQNIGELLVFIILAFLVNLAGLLACIIGLVATLPTTAIGAAYAWRWFTRGPIAPQP